MKNDYESLSDEMAAAIENSGPSVVAVDARRRLPATGIVWNSDGVIVTAHHVIERDEEIGVGLHDGSTVTAKLIGLDPQNDIALLQAEGEFTPANWAKTEDIKIGHLVLAVGRPFGDLQASLGTVSALSGGQNFGFAGKRKNANRPGRGSKAGRGQGQGRGSNTGRGQRGDNAGRGQGREDNAGRSQGRGNSGSGQGRKDNAGRGQGRGIHQDGRLHGEGRRFRPHRQGRGWRQSLAGGHIRSDAIMYPGFSGGPLLGAYGTIYGMNTSGFMHKGGLAIPVSSVEKSVNALLTHGRVRQGYLGVRTHTAELPEAIADELGQKTGTLVISVIADSPAQKSDLLVGDIIVGINEEIVTDAESLPLALAGDLIGVEVTGNIVRGGELQEITITLGEQE
jgi:S1-C subfamily serine protease